MRCVPRRIASPSSAARRRRSITAPAARSSASAIARLPPNSRTARSRCGARSTGTSNRSWRSQRALPPLVRELLRLAIYELTYTRADEHATVFEFVNVAKRHAHRGLANLVNAVLRSFLRQRPPAPQRERFASEQEYLATRYSLPTWLVRQWRDIFGGDAGARFRGVNDPAQAALVVNALTTTPRRCCAAARWRWESKRARSTDRARGALVGTRRRCRRARMACGGRSPRVPPWRSTCSVRSPARRCSTSAAGAATRRCRSPRDWPGKGA